MKKVWLFSLVVVALLVTAGVSVSAQSPKQGHSFFWGASMGLLTGTGEEIVYRDKSTQDKLSQLLWNFNALLCSGLHARYTWQAERWGLFAGASSKIGLPKTAGVMEDRDWVAQDYPDWLTHYSVHDNKTEDALLFDADIGASFTLRNRFQLKIAAAYHFMQFSWTAKGGSLLYPNVDMDGDNKPDGVHLYYPSPIDVVTYEQTWHIVSPVIGFSGAFNQYFSLDLSLALSPLLWFSGKDHHILRDLVITEDLSDGFFFEGGLCLSFKSANNVTFSFSAVYRNISGVRGDGHYDYENDADFVIPDMVGSGYAAWDTGITVKWAIGQ
jgi:outer membrane protease